MTQQEITQQQPAHQEDVQSSHHDAEQPERLFSAPDWFALPLGAVAVGWTVQEVATNHNVIAAGASMAVFATGYTAIKLALDNRRDTSEK